MRIIKIAVAWNIDGNSSIYISGLPLGGYGALCLGGKYAGKFGLMVTSIHYLLFGLPLLLNISDVATLCMDSRSHWLVHIGIQCARVYFLYCLTTTIQAL